MSNLIGQTLGRYHILEQLGEGGMAVVYKALDTRLNRQVALKVIRTERLTLETMDKTLKRFEREARALARLTHTNIVSILDFGEYEGKPYLVLPFIPGGTLKERLGHPLPWRESARLLVPIARALHYAHQQKIVHRDVKPSNIMLDPSGDSLLTDFGIAKVLLDTEETSDLTGTGMGIGTPEYMSPEQFQGMGVDARADIYSLGVVFYEMVTGKKPFTAKTPAAIMVKQATEPLPRPSMFVMGLPRSVEQTLLKALAKKPQDRFNDMGEFLRALEAIAQGREDPVGAMTGTASMDDSYDTFDTYQVEDSTSSTVDQNARRGTVSTVSVPVQRSSKWIPWALGGLGFCLVGAVAVVIISILSASGGSGSPSNNEPYTYQQPAPSNEFYPSPLPTNTEYVYVAPPEQPTQEPVFTDLPTAVPSPTKSLSCPGVPAQYPTRLQADRDAWVCTQSERLIVRKKAGMNAPELFSLYPKPKTYVRVVQGPVCADNFWWWKIEIYPGTVYGLQGHSYSQTWTTDRTYTGWAREGWDETDAYFLCQ